jgi:MraZ protein
MFSGFFPATLDAKYRIIVPSGFRDPMLQHYNNKVVLTKDLQAPVILIWPQANFQKLMESLSAAPKWDKAITKARAFYVACAYQGEFDANGRIFVPEPLRTHVGLQREVAVVGNLKNLQIWPADKWAEYDRNLSEQSEIDVMLDALNRHNVDY